VLLLRVVYLDAALRAFPCFESVPLTLVAVLVLLARWVVPEYLAFDVVADCILLREAAFDVPAAVMAALRRAEFTLPEPVPVRVAVAAEVPAVLPRVLP
jgi:hypothetical protein